MLRGNKVKVPAIVVIAFFTCLVRVLLVGDTVYYVPDSEREESQAKEEQLAVTSQQRIIRLDNHVLRPIGIDGREGEMILSINSDDLDDMLSKTAESEVPQLPNLLLHDPNICHNIPRLNFIVYVHSAPENSFKRNLLRKSYANTRLFKNRNFVVIFLLGLPKKEGVQQLVKKEFEEHRDIVQGFFIDDYRNITLKAVMGLNWITAHCPEAPFALKVDDDSFLNIFEVLPVIEMAAAAENQSLFLACPIWEKGSMKILREKKTCMKWCVTKRELAGTFYPRYCAGIAYAMSRDLVRVLRDRAKVTPFFWIDDVYITGLLTQPIVDQISYINLISHVELYQDLAIRNYGNMSEPLHRNIVHARNSKTFISLWNFLLQRLTAKQRSELNEEVLQHLP